MTSTGRSQAPPPPIGTTYRQFDKRPFMGIPKDKLVYPGVREVVEMKRRKVEKYKESLERQYTDIYDHTYDPFNGIYMVIGTSRGQVTVISGASTDLPNFTQAFSVGDKKPITSLKWGENGLSIASGATLNFYKTSAHDLTIPDKPLVSMGMPSNIVDMCNIPSSPERIAILTENGRTRIYDMNTEQLLTVFTDHKLNGTACKSSGRKIVTSGSDGSVFLYDASLRTVKPTSNFLQERPVSTIAISECESYLAIAPKHASTPIVYNLRAKFSYDPIVIQENLNIRAVAFGTHGDMFWGGTNSTLYCSQGINGTPRKLVACYGEKEIPAINSIALPPSDTESHGHVSVAGDSHSVLISNRGCNYWKSMMHMIKENDEPI